MSIISSHILSLYLACLAIGRNVGVYAENSYSWTPSVSLTENYGEDDGLCLDISGFGNNINCDSMQIHTCKQDPQDTQFLFDFDSGEIRSVNYDSDCDSTGGDDSEGGCVTVSGTEFRISGCDGRDSQKFEFSSGRIMLASDTGLCMAKTGSIRDAGRYVAADLGLVECDSVDSDEVNWTVSGAANDSSGSDSSSSDSSEIDPTPSPTRRPTNKPTRAPTTIRPTVRTTAASSQRSSTKRPTNSPVSSDIPTDV